MPDSYLLACLLEFFSRPSLLRCIPRILLVERRIQITIKKLPGVLEILFGVGDRSGDAREGFIEDGDDALLFGEVWYWKLDRLDLFGGKMLYGRKGRYVLYFFKELVDSIEQEPRQQTR